MPQHVGMQGISIHALREEGDEVHEAMDKYIDEFLSTPSARRATEAHLVMATARSISIHALREEGDAVPLSVM